QRRLPAPAGRHATAIPGDAPCPRVVIPEAGTRDVGMPHGQAGRWTRRGFSGLPVDDADRAAWRLMCRTSATLCRRCPAVASADVVGGSPKGLAAGATKTGR